MKKILLPLLILIILSFSACDINFSKEPFLNLETVFGTSADENPFTEPRIITGLNDNNTPGNFKFLIMTDTHFGYEKKDAYFVYDKFKQWATTNSSIIGGLDFIAHLGDITDNSDKEDFESFKTYYNEVFHDKPLITTPGNHDNRRGGLDRYREVFGFDITYYRFDYNGVHFYLPDSSFRTFGKKQYQQLTQALAQDKDAPKIILSHVPLYGGPGVIYASFSDMEERNGILKAMVDNNVGIYMAGHNHVGNIVTRLNSNSAEFLSASMLGGTFRNIKPSFYIAEYTHVDKKITITPYEFDKEDNEFKALDTFSFPL